MEMRLIDVDKIIDSLGISDTDFAIGAVIDEQPTAFDVDKVAERLEEYPRNGKCENYYDINAKNLVKGNIFDNPELLQEERR